MELFHPYKKLLENMWRKPELYFLRSSSSQLPSWEWGVLAKPKLREIEMYVTALRLVWPEYRTKFLNIMDVLEGPLSEHYRNILLALEFMIPAREFC